MPRPIRFTPAEVPVHVTQRGEASQPLFAGESDYAGFLELLGRYSADAGNRVAGYCLMPDHYHLVVIPAKEEGVSRMMQAMNSMFARLLNLRMERAGHVWRGRFGSTSMEEPQYRAALAYVELNPVRSGLARGAVGYPWSSAAAHAGLVEYPSFLDKAEFARLYSAREWRERLKAEQSEAEVTALRRATQLGTVAGSVAFVKELEAKYGRKLLRRPRGRPAKSMAVGR